MHLNARKAYRHYEKLDSVINAWRDDRPCGKSPGQFRRKLAQQSSYYVDEIQNSKKLKPALKIGSKFQH